MATKPKESLEEMVMAKIKGGLTAKEIFNSMRSHGYKRAEIDGIVEAFYMSPDESFDLVRRRVQVIVLRGLERINNELADIPIDKVSDTLVKAKRIANELPTSVTINNNNIDSVEISAEDKRLKLIASLTAPKKEKKGMKNVTKATDS
jgi:hypothetical protein